jgi:amino acid transporter/mannitol/fructose-specific phosphotransferase system IIA component (Ntr-type)
MVSPTEPRHLRKELSFLSLYAIATGTTLGPGLFIVPALAARDAGPAVVLSYVIAAMLVIPAMVSIVELSTAMPRAGGLYYFLDRSLGPLAGTVGGLGTWSALVLKTAFALFGMGAYIRLVVPEAPILAVAMGIALLLGVLNLLGARTVGGVQLMLVLFLLVILVWFVGRGSASVERAAFDGFFDAGFDPIIAAAGLACVSYVGLTKAASVSEEVHNPERNLPRAIFLALLTAAVVYAAAVSVMVGVVGTEGLARTFTPVATAAAAFAGRFGELMICVAALLAFCSVANAGILSASRYPLAMSRDHLVPRPFRRLGRRGTPGYSIGATVAAIVLALLVLHDPGRIAKLASAFQLLTFGLACLAVIVMRHSGLDSYDPGFRSPLYPWLQIVGIIAPFWIITEMGWLPVLFSGGLVAAGIGWYYLYARRRVERHGAVYHVFERLGRRRYPGLDAELRAILKEKGLREEDPFEEIVASAPVIVASSRESFESLAERAGALLARAIAEAPQDLARRFVEGTRTGITPVAGGIALPHLRLPGIEEPRMVLVQCAEGLALPQPMAPPGTAAGLTYAVFFVVSPLRDPARHLRLLAQIAGRAEKEGFLGDWRIAGDEQALKESLLRDDRYLNLPVLSGTPSSAFAGKAIRDIRLPQGCLIAIIRRHGSTIVPAGGTIVLPGDWLTLIGSAPAIRELRAIYGAAAAKVGSSAAGGPMEPEIGRHPGGRPAVEDRP